MTHRTIGRARVLSRLCLSVAVALTAAACDDLLEVENPASINEDDVRNPESAELWANGAMLSVQDGWDGVLTILSTASDELRFRGAHQWWQELDLGRISDPDNSGLDGAFRQAASGRWMADEARSVLDSLHREGALADAAPLARVYLYGAIAHATLADALEDFAPSDRTEPGPALGPENMASLYDTAVAYTTRGLALHPDVEMRRNLLALRARAGHARQVWRRIRPPPADMSGGGLVTDAGAVQDALAAVAEDGGDWRFTFEYPFGVIGFDPKGESCFGNLSFGDRYQSPAGAQIPDAVVLVDPLDGVPDPWVERFVLTQYWTDGPCANGTFTVFSAREMHLIVAEDALVRNDLDTFAAHVNTVRGWESLTPWSPGSGVAARDLLIYERQSQLLLTGRRLADMYRFGIHSDTWDPTSIAATMPGTLFPIPTSEVEANCYLNGSCR